VATLVIGGCGFIGSHIVAALEAAGDEIVVFDRSADVRAAPRGRVRLVRGEFGNRGALEKILEGQPFSSVVHLAGSTVPGNSNRDPQFDVITNVCETIALLDLCVRHRVGKVLFLSSGGAVYGIPRKTPVAEDHPTDPISSYGITKLAVEKYLRLYQHLHGLDYVVIRAANPFGPGQRPNAEQGAVAVFAWRILRGEELVVWGDGSVVRDYFHVRDLARLCAAALASSATGVFNAGSGTGRSLCELIAAMEQRFGAKARVRYEQGRALDVPRIVLDISAARRTFGWSPQIDFGDGLDETRAWLSGEYESLMKAAAARRPG
jgi:UDP-glucose 4-epimerase